MKLREWLFKNRLSVTYFAAILKVDRSYVHMWLRGTKFPSQELLDKIRTLTVGKVRGIKDLKDVKRAGNTQRNDPNVLENAPEDESVSVS
jgi:transcriptional regulator with XRE-family HTH domain